MSLPRVVISAPHRSSGKTTLSIGICAALTESGYKVQPFKKGPDFIDPMWLTSATGRDCYNLDFFMMGEENIQRSFQKAAADADISVVEGNMGLYDGMEVDGKGSTADMARVLKAPVILVVDTAHMTRSIAPLVQGFQNFEPDISIAGVILNKISNPRHESKLRAALEHYCDIAVVGAIPRLPAIGILQRHLGLRPSREEDKAMPIIDSIKDAIKEYVDLAQLVQIAKSSPPQAVVSAQTGAATLSQAHASPKVRLGVAKDKAFTFYYPENLEALRAAGAELVYFSPMHGTLPEDVDGLYIGGGFPEVFMKELEDNGVIREQIRTAIERGMPVYAECGGLMYLSRGISWNGVTRDMVGALPCDITMFDKPRGHGYIRLQTTGDSWLQSETEIRAHEFHYSEAKNVGDVAYAYSVLRGKGVDGKRDGIVYKNVLASYAHLHSLAATRWAEQFIAFILR